MMSYTWGDKIKDVALALWLWAAGTGRDPETIHIWIYSLCIDQWSLPADLALAFKSRVERIGLLLPLRTPFDRPAYVTRLWCLYEMYTATSSPTCCVDMILPPAQLQRLEATLTYANSFELQEDVLAAISCADADASILADRDMLRALIQDSCGFHMLDAVVRANLEGVFKGLTKGWLAMLPAAAIASPPPHAGQRLRFGSNPYERPVRSNPDYGNLDEPTSIRDAPPMAAGN